VRQLPVPPDEYDKEATGRIQEILYNTIQDDLMQKRQDIDVDGKAAADSTRAMFLGRVLLMSPNGTKYQLLVDNSGNLSTTSTV
jgi:hypothetical protein